MSRETGKKLNREREEHRNVGMAFPVLIVACITAFCIVMAVLFR